MEYKPNQNRHIMAMGYRHPFKINDIELWAVEYYLNVENWVLDQGLTRPETLNTQHSTLNFQVIFNDQLSMGNRAIPN